MSHHRAHTCLVIVVTFIACQKHRSNPLPVAAKVNIAIVSGNDQSDTAGRILPNELEIGVTADGQPMPGGLVKIVQHHCSYTDSSFWIADANGKVSFSWQLDGEIGAQGLTIYAVDSAHRLLDSTTATANGLYFDHVWIPSTCLPKSNNGLLSLAELSNGRILLGDFKLFYSDDSGKRWAVLPSFSSYNVTSMAVNGNNVFVTIAGNQQPLYYSTDNGLTWQTSAQTANFGSTVSVWATKSGRIFLNASNEVYLSTDVGQTWKNLSTEPNGLGSSAYYSYFCESTDGTIYAVNNNLELWVSEDGGGTWIKSLLNSVNAVFSDDNGQIYISTTATEGQLFKLVSTGSTESWNLLCSFANMPGTGADIVNLMEVGNVFYFTLDGYGLMKTGDFVNFKQVRGPDFGASLITGKGVAIICDNGVFPVLYNTGP